MLSFNHALRIATSEFFYHKDMYILRTLALTFATPEEAISYFKGNLVFQNEKMESNKESIIEDIVENTFKNDKQVQRILKDANATELPIEFNADIFNRVVADAAGLLLHTFVAYKKYLEKTESEIKAIALIDMELQQFTDFLVEISSSILAVTAILYPEYFNTLNICDVDTLEQNPDWIDNLSKVSSPFGLRVILLFLQQQSPSPLLNKVEKFLNELVEAEVGIFNIKVE